MTDAGRRKPSTPASTLEATRSRIRTELRDASELLLCLDFDGTLAPIVDDPDDARMTSASESAVAALADRPSVHTAVVSGRALDDVRDRVGLDITYAGNHGLELATDEGTAVHPVAEKRARRIGAVCETLDVALDPIPNAHVEDKGLTGTVHVRTVPAQARDPVDRITRGVVDRLGGDDLETSPGKCIIEFSPSLDWGKGDAVSLLESRHDGNPFVVYVGDDVTDESAFRVVEPEGIGVHVGSDDSTAASCRVESPADVASLLDWVAKSGADALESEPIPSGVATR